jgi:hypothetical protein
MPNIIKRSQTKFHKLSLYVLLALDISLILITAVIGFLVFSQTVSAIPDVLNIEADWSLGEILNYAKWVILISVFFRAFRKTRLSVFRWITVIFIIILADDSLQIHERTGDVLAHIFGGRSGLSSALGEMAFWTCLGVLCLGLLFSAWSQTPQETRKQLWPLGALFGCVVFCGFVVDFIHFLSFTPLMAGIPLISGILLLIEDGGEMVFASLMVAYSICIFGPVAEARPNVKSRFMRQI